MTYDLLLALIGFAFATSVTPGPNNMMLLASGANFGFRRSVPHMLGISLGVAAMILLFGLGLEQVLRAVPQLTLVLKLASTVYMLWLAWKIAHATAPQTGDAETQVGGRPFTFLQAAGFQWVNPKAWALALTAVTVYAGGQGWAAVLTVALVCAVVNLPSISVWAATGTQLRRWLTSNRRLQVFNWTMAVLLVASLWPVLRA